MYLFFIQFFIINSGNCFGAILMFLSVIFIIVFACLGFLSPANRGSFMTCGLVCTTQFVRNIWDTLFCVLLIAGLW